MTNTRLIICSDIHGNLANFQTFLNGIRALNYDSLYCLGDIVDSGNSSEENEIVDAFRQNNIASVAGNHDMVAGVCLNNLTPENTEYLRNLPVEIQKENMTFFHSSLLIPTRRLNDIDTLASEADHIHSTRPHIKYAFHGHTHKYGVYSRSAKLYSREKQFILDADDFYLLNPGSIGDTRVKNTFAFLNTETNEFRILTLDELARMSGKTDALRLFNKTINEEQRREQLEIINQ